MSTVFPKWTNRLPAMIAGMVLSGATLAVGGAWYYFTPKYWRVGYMPAQPHITEALHDKLTADARAASRPPLYAGQQYAGFSHQIHAGKLGLDCRYCHSNVEVSAEANIPSVGTCIGCHADGHVGEAFARKDRVDFVRYAWAADEPIEWRRVHKTPDYVRNFPHHIHVNAGVSCFSCHGAIMEMPVVFHAEPMSMSWCLDCHRDPTPHLVPKDKVTDLYWVREQLTTNANAASSGKDVLNTGSPGGAALLKALEEKNMHLLPQNCGACHY